MTYRSWWQQHGDTAKGGICVIAAIALLIAFGLYMYNGFEGAWKELATEELEAYGSQVVVIASHPEYVIVLNEEGERKMIEVAHGQLPVDGDIWSLAYNEDAWDIGLDTMLQGSSQTFLGQHANEQYQEILIAYCSK